MDSIILSDVIWRSVQEIMSTIQLSQVLIQIIATVWAIFISFTLLMGKHEKWTLKKIIIRIKSYLYSIIINFAYGLGLSIFGGYAIYWASVLHGIDITWSILILSAYFVIELRALFYEDAIKDPYHLTSWRSLPTIGILASTPLVFLFTLVCQRRLGLFSIEGLLNVWATIRYNIVNPRWQQPNEDNTTFIGGPRNRTPTRHHKHAQWVYRLLKGYHAAKNSE